MHRFPCILTQENASAQFGFSLNTLRRVMPVWPDMRYRLLDEAETRAIQIGIEARMQEGMLRIAGSNDNTVWERGWGELAARIAREGFSSDLLRPQYFDQHRILRLQGQYIESASARMVYDYDQIIRRAALAQYLEGTEHILELGCGTGATQLMLAGLYPQARLSASDWTLASKRLVEAVSSYAEKPVDFIPCNLLTLEGWDHLPIQANTDIVTIHALEQLAAHWQPWLDAMMRTPFRRCLHIEPIYELYDQQNAFDALAARYHAQRDIYGDYCLR